MTAPIHVGTTKQLFLDDHVVDAMDNVVRQYHRPVRCGKGPVVMPDRPWEQGGGGVYLFGGSALYDESEGHFKMWYRASLPMGESSSGRGIEPEGGYKACYAVSDDGVSWEKPKLGLADYAGSKRNNTLPPGIGGEKHIRRPNLIKDYLDPDPDRRYKMVYMDRVGEAWALAKGYSRNGVEWRMNVGEPHAFDGNIAPNGILFGWDPRLGEFVHYHRSSDIVRADVDGRSVRKKKAVMRTSSADFEQWGATAEALTPAPSDPSNWSPSHGVDLAGVLYTDDLYVGSVDTASTYHVEEADAEEWTLYRSREFADYRTELVYSRDGKTWRRAAPFWEFMRPGAWGTWDRDHIGLAKPIVHNDQLLFYYSGSNVPMGSNAPGHPLADVINTAREGQWMGHAIGLATMRLDGFVSVDGYDEAGTLTTKPLVFEGRRLELNLRAPWSAFGETIGAGRPYGACRVEFLDRFGRGIGGARGGLSDAFTGDSLRHAVTWGGDANVATLAGEALRLRFHMRNTALYAFRFLADADTPQTPANIMEPGSRGYP